MRLLAIEFSSFFFSSLVTTPGLHPSAPIPLHPHHSCDPASFLFFPSLSCPPGPFFFFFFKPGGAGDGSELLLFFRGSPVLGLTGFFLWFHGHALLSSPSMRGGGGGVFWIWTPKSFPDVPHFSSDPEELYRSCRPGKFSCAFRGSPPWENVFDVGTSPPPPLPAWCSALPFPFFCLQPPLPPELPFNKAPTGWVPSLLARVKKTPFRSPFFFL